MPGSVVLGCGSALPPGCVDAGTLAFRLGSEEAAVVAATGVPTRYYAEAGMGPSDLATAAAREALAAAGVGPEAIDLVVFATMTPDIAFPGSGVFLQHKLGCRTVGAMDVRAQCAGFLFALVTGDRFVRAGRAGRVLVAGAEVHSSALDFSARGRRITPFFGDGAAALVLGTGDGAGVLASVLHSDPTDMERFWCEFPASRHYPARMELSHFEAGRHFYRLDPERLHADAEAALASAAAAAVARAGCRREDVALLVAHYVDPRVARRAVEAAGWPSERVVVPGETVGHVAAAGPGMALAEAVRSGRVDPGDVVVLSAFGAGLSWGAVVVRL